MVSGSVADLVRAIQQEEVKVHVDIARRIESMTLMNLPTDCHPGSAITDKIASEMAKRRKSLGLPELAVCPYFPMNAFVPSWATGVSTLCGSTPQCSLCIALLTG